MLYENKSVKYKSNTMNTSCQVMIQYVTAVELESNHIYFHQTNIGNRTVVVYAIETSSRVDDIATLSRLDAGFVTPI